MLLFYIRHGDPTYDPDELTPLGKRQAESVAKRLALYGIDSIYASTSNRAIQTAQPTCELLKKHIPGSGTYKFTKSNPNRVALFAHNNFGLAFLSSILDIPYPAVCSHFDMGHSNMTVIHFKEEDDGLSAPVILSFSNDSHLYRDGLPTKFNNTYYF